MNKYDLTIVGGGIVGLSLACALSSKMRIAVVEARTPEFNWHSDSFGLRVSAITPASRRLFQNIGVWSVIENDRVAAYDEMLVFDGESEGSITFSSQDIGESTLGHIIENRVIQKVLWEKVSASCDVFSPVKFTDIIEKDNGVQLVLDDNRVVNTSLLVAADGAFSAVRKFLGVDHKERDYGHTAIVANIQCEKPHANIARQRFEKTGPLALLPISDPNVCSIVWSQTHDEAQRLLGMDTETFNRAITLRFESRLGNLQLLSERVHFPLLYRHAESYLHNKCIFVGDAAHTIHPLAGQGLNLGLGDVSDLVNVIDFAVEKQRDFTARDTLRKYERAARARNVSMLTAMDGFRLLFGSENPYVLHARSQGLSFFNNHRFLKSLFVPA